VAPAGSDTRPTSDRVREAVFNILYSLLGGLEGASVVDLFAGSGAMGIEALSRGADSAVFVESSREAVEAVRENLRAADVEDRADVVVGDVRRFLASSDRSFDVAIVDPPYSFDGWDDLLADLSADVVVIESDRAVAVPEGWETHRVKRYGGTVVTIASARRAGSEHSGSSTS
jgi:16S rRNA (guanine966-N2)-methyltransferase